MNKKIDASLKNMVTVATQNKINCLVYANSLPKLRFMIEKYSLGEVVQEYPFVHACEVNLPRGNLEKVAKFGIVEYMTSSTKVATLLHVSKKIIGLESFTYKSNFSCVVIDTGCDKIIDLSIPQNNILHFVDFVHDKCDPYDDNGHGTMVVSAITSNGTLSNGKYAGVAKGVPCIVLKALDKNGETSSFTILKAMQWVADHQKEYNIKVVCMSFGSFPLERLDPLVMGAEVLWNKGIVVVSACGNSGPELMSIKSPGISTKIITVGALDDGRVGEKFEKKRFKVADFSSRGPAFGNYKPDLIAPGVEVIASSAYHKLKKHYSTMSGTSIATPIVAGVVCQMLQEQPTLTPDMVKRILISHCYPIVQDRNVEGHGYLSFKGKE